MDDTLKLAMMDAGVVPVRIRIIKTPRGDVPEWVRQQWVGLELEAILVPEGFSRSEGILTREPAEPWDHYLCPLTCLDVLAQASPAAAVWFIQNLAQDDCALSFVADEVEIMAEN